jgi:hypothetical protein
MITLMLYLQWIFLAVLVGFHVSKFGASIFQPNIIYFVFHFIVFVFHPTLVYAFDFKNMFEYLHFYPDEGDAANTFLVADLGLLVFTGVGWWMSRRLNPRGVFPRPEASPLPNVDSLLRSSFLVTAVLLGPAAVWSLLYNFTHPIIGAHNGDLSSITLTKDAATGVTLFTNSTGYIVDLQFMMATLSIGWAYLNRFRLIHMIPFVVYAFFRAYAGAGRFTFMLLAVAFALVYLMQKRLTRPTSRMILIGLALFTLFAAIGNDRGFVKKLTGTYSSVEAGVEEDRGPRRLQDMSILNGADFANYEYLSYVVHHVPKSFGTYTYFTQYLDIVIKPIPRMLWPGKPVKNLIPMIDLNAVGVFSGLTVSLVGDGWMSLGFFGVVMTMAIASLICNGFYLKFARTPQSHFGALAYCIFLSLAPEWFRDGAVYVLEFAGAHLAPLVVWWLIWRYLANARGPQRVTGGVARPPVVRRPSAHLNFDPETSPTE